MICKRGRFPVLVILVLIFMVLSNPSALFSQNEIEEEKTRGLKPRDYAKSLQKRIAKKRPESKRPVAVKSEETASYALMDPDSDDILAQGVNIGVIVWRLREAKEDDDEAVVEKQRIAKRVNARIVETDIRLTPERAKSDMEFSDGEMMRLSIEVPLEGYIYIINREQYSNGQFSDPYLIFPGKSDIGRTNRSIAGRLLYIPNERDYFELTPLSNGGPNKTAEVFTVLVSETPVKGLPPLGLNEENRKIDRRKFDRWQKVWGSRVIRFEKEGGAGRAITEAEKNAGMTGSEALTQDSPPPQTIFHIAEKQGPPLLFNIPVRIRH